MSQEMLKALLSDLSLMKMGIDAEMALIDAYIQTYDHSPVLPSQLVKLTDNMSFVHKVMGEKVELLRSLVKIDTANILLSDLTKKKGEKDE